MMISGALMKINPSNIINNEGKLRIDIHRCVHFIGAHNQ